MNKAESTDDLDLQERVLKGRLETAQGLMDSGKLEEAERLYMQTLEQAESVTGKDSLLAGLVLLDLFGLYDKQGRDEEGKALWGRMRRIVILNLQGHL